MVRPFWFSKTTANLPLSKYRCLNAAAGLFEVHKHFSSRYCKYCSQLSMTQQLEPAAPCPLCTAWSNVGSDFSLATFCNALACGSCRFNCSEVVSSMSFTVMVQSSSKMITICKDEMWACARTARRWVQLGQPQPQLVQWHARAQPHTHTHTFCTSTTNNFLVAHWTAITYLGPYSSTKECLGSVDSCL